MSTTKKRVALKAAKKPGTKKTARRTSPAKKRPRTTAKTTARKPAPKRAATKKPPAPKRVASGPRASAPRKAATPAARPARVPATGEHIRRAVFIDVENTSNEADLLEALHKLGIDRAMHSTEVIAVGNWRSVAQGLARQLAIHGAQLVHSAPPVGVRDWSDLWIAVAAGRWLATAGPGDLLEIVSEDRAFDAVADAAAAAGVTYKRVTWRTTEKPAAAEAAPARRRSRRGGRRRRARTVESGATPAAPPATATLPAAASEEEAHTASLEQIRSTIASLAAGDTARWISLDTLANALKDAGFVRLPGSPRLVTRLRKMKDVEVHPDGAVRLTTGAIGPEAAASSSPSGERRPRRRRRRRPKPAGSAAAPESATESAAAPADTGGTPMEMSAPSGEDH